MTLGEILLLTVVIAISFQFWRLRGIAETTVGFAKQYCQREGLQYISLARVSTKIGFHKGKLDWKNRYEISFSSDGENAYTGYIYTIGKSIIKVDLPAFRIVSEH